MKHPSIQVSKYPSIQVSKYLVLALTLGLVSFSSIATAKVFSSAYVSTTTVPVSQTDQFGNFDTYVYSATGLPVSATINGSRNDDHLVEVPIFDDEGNYQGGYGYYETGSSSGSAFASADLRTGQLKSSATLNVNNRPDLLEKKNSINGSIFLTETSDRVESMAAIGDEFTTYQNGSPLIQSANNQAKFVFDISGINDLQADGFGPREDGQNVYGTRLSLDIYKNDSDIEIYNPTNPNLTTVSWIISDFEVGFGQPNLQYVGNNSLIEYSFNPEESFKWRLSLYSVVAFGIDINVGSGVLDYSHTINVSYIGAEGTTTVSASGLFPISAPTSTVPVPAAAWLFSSAMLGLIGLRRKIYA